MTDDMQTNDIITPAAETVKWLFAPGANRRFVIPNYQRDYSWNKKEGQVSQFFDDIVNRVHVTNDGNQLSCKSESYFIGTMLFKGDRFKDDGVLEVIDGQQRLTTIYLFLGALSNRLRDTSIGICNRTEKSEIKTEWSKLANNFKIFSEKIKSERLLTQTRAAGNDTKVRLEVSKRNNGVSVMEILVFGSDEERRNIHPINQAEKNLIDAYYFMYEQLGFRCLTGRNSFSDYFNNQDTDFDSRGADNSYPPVDERIEKEWLDNYRRYEVLLYDGVLGQLDVPSVIVLSMLSEKRVNEVFESLNSRGKNLEQVDLIKNNVFDRLPAEPLDRARKYWGEIKDSLSKEKNDDSNSDPWIRLEDFFLMFWVAEEQGESAVADKLYAKFVGSYKNAGKTDVIDFLSRSEKFAHDVAAVYGNENIDNIVDVNYREHISDGLRYMVRVQRARQSYPLLAAALHSYRNNAIKVATLVELLDFLAIAFLFLTAKDVRGSKYTKFLNNAAFALTRISHGKNGRDYISQKLKKELSTFYVRQLEDQLAALINEPSDKDLDNILDGEKGFYYCYSNKDESLRKNKLRISYLLRVNCFRMLCAYKGFRSGSESNFKWNIEHILPDQKEKDSLTHQLGNLLWLDKDTNDKCANKPVVEKIKIYQQSASPEIGDLKDFFASLSRDDDSAAAAIKYRSRRILHDLYIGVIGQHKKADEKILKRFSLFESSKFSKKKYLCDLMSKNWYHSFSSRVVGIEIKSLNLLEKGGCIDDENYSINGILLPKNSAFVTPFICMSGANGIAQIDFLLEYIDKVKQEGKLIFRRADEDFKKDEIFPENFVLMLKQYREFLKSSD